MKLFDSHCHLNFPEFDNDRVQVIQQCRARGLSGLCIPATRSVEWSSLINLAGMQGLQQYVALGLHPYFLSDHKPGDLEQLDYLLSQRHAHVVAVGETGLDFYNRTLSQNDRNQQIFLFTEQVKLAANYQLPLIIHARKSHDVILKILRSLPSIAGGIVHAFSGSEQQALHYIELGFLLGFGGGITYHRAVKTRQLATNLPLSSIVLETDAPDMPLSGFQGQRNSPDRLPLIAQCLAELRGLSVSEVAEQTTNNCLKLFL